MRVKQFAIGVMRVTLGVTLVATGVMQTFTGVMRAAIGVSHLVMGVMSTATGVMQSSVGVMRAAMVVMCEEKAVAPHPAVAMELPVVRTPHRMGAFRVAVGVALDPGDWRRLWRL